MARSKLWFRCRRTRLAAAVVLAAVGFSLGAAGDGVFGAGLEGRSVEVRAAGRLLASKALLVDHDEHGLALRVQDLEERLPSDLPRPIPVLIDGEHYMPLLPILVKHVVLDRQPSVLEFVGVSYPGGPQKITAAIVGTSVSAPLPPKPLPVTPQPTVALGDGGAISSLLGLDAPVAIHRLAKASSSKADGETGVGDLLSQKNLDGWTVVPTAEDLGDKAELVPVAAGKFAGTVKGVNAGATGGTIRRRDPLDLPLLQSEEWQESLTEIVINGNVVSDGAFTLQGPDGEWALKVVDLRTWRVRLDEALIRTFNGEPYYLIDDLVDGDVDFDDRSLSLSFSLSTDRLEETKLDQTRASTLPPQSGRGAFVDYDVQYLTGDGVRERLDALLELGAFDEIGVLVSDFRLGDITEEAELVRLETSFTKDFPKQRASLRLGDAVTVGGVLGRPVRFGGVQFASNFSTDPSFITFPLPTIGGLAEQNSVAEVFLDNTVRVSEEVPAGPFEIDNLPVVTGAGEVQLRVTDLLGREQFLTQSYYVSPRLLKSGLSDYAVELGFERERFNEKNFDYGRPLMIGSYSYGITNGLTGDSRLELSDDRQVLGIGGAALLGPFGLISTGLVGSHDDDAGGGYEVFADYEYRASNFNIGLRTEYAHENFRQIGQDNEPIKRTDQIAAGVGLSDFGRIGAILINTETRDDRNRRSLVGNYSVPLGPGSFLFSALRNFVPDEELALTASYSLPLSPIRSITATGNYRDEASGARFQYNRGRGGSDLGASYRLATEVGETPRRIDGTIRYDAPQATGTLDAVYVNDEVTARANVSGSVGLIDGRPAVSRRLGRAFGMVALPGHPDVTVYLENREVGRTDEDGYLFLPRLNPYQENRIRIRAEDLPLDTEIDSEELVAVPFDRSGVKVAFNVQTNRSALATLLDAAGLPLPAGMEMITEDGTLEARVADQGLAYIKGSGDGGTDLVSKPGLPPHRCPLPPMPSEPMSSLGEIRCE